MRRRKTMLWVTAFLLLLPVVMAGADVAQRANEGEVIFRTEDLRSGDRFVYALDYESTLHNDARTIAEYLVIEVGQVEPYRQANGVAVPVVPISTTRTLASFDLLRTSYGGPRPFAVEGVEQITYLFGRDDGIHYARSLDDGPVRYTRLDNGTIERTQESTLVTAHGTYASLFAATWHPGLVYRHAAAPIAVAFDLIGINGPRAHEDGRLDGRHVYNVGPENPSRQAHAGSSFTCFHPFPALQYVDFVGGSRFDERELDEWTTQDVWLAPELPLPAMSACTSTYVEAQSPGRVVESIRHVLRLSSYEPGLQRLEVPWERGFRAHYAPEGALPPSPPGPAGTPSDGAGSPLRVSLEKAVAAITGSDDPQIKAFLNPGEVPFLVEQAMYQPLGAPRQTATGMPAPTIPGLPLPTNVADAAGVEYDVVWWFFLKNARMEALSVRTAWTVADDGARLGSSVEVTDSAPALESPGPLRPPVPQMIPIAAVLARWSEETGRDLNEWRDATFSSLTFGYGGGAGDNGAGGLRPTFRIAASLAEGQTQGSPSNRHSVHEYAARDGAALYVQETAYETTYQADAPAPAPAALAQIVVGPGHQPTAAAFGGLAVIVAFAIAAFWDAVRSAFIKFIFLPLYAKISKDKLLDHATRDEIIAFVQENAGTNQSEVRAALGVGFGTAMHHLTVLERNQLILSTRVGRQRCYFTPGQIDFRQRRATGLVRSPAAKRMLAAIRAHPGISQADLSAALGVTPRAVRAQAERLEEVGAIATVRRGRKVSYTLGDAS